MAQLELKIGDKTHNKAWVDNLSSTSQISSDPASVNYGVIPSTGNATMRDINGQIRADIENNVLPISNAPTKISINGNQVQEHTTSDSDYNIIDKSLSLQFSDRLSLLDKVTYGGMPLREYSMTAYDMLDDVIGSYGGYCRECPINWTKYQHGDAIKINSDIDNSQIIKVTTGSGWEIIGAPIKITPNVRHTLKYWVDIKRKYTALETANGIMLQILSSEPTDSDCSDISLGTITLPTDAGDNIGTIGFTPTSDTVYFVVNFGGAADGQDISVEIGTIEVDGKALSSCLSKRVLKSKTGGRVRYDSVFGLLDSIYIDYPYLPQASYRETIEKFCNLGQLTMALDENGTIQFYSARPRYTDDEKIINVPNSYKISNLKKTVFLKNKIDGVDIKQSKVKDEVVVATNIYNWDSSLDKFSKYTDTATANDVEISITYYNGQIIIPKKSNDNLEKMLRISDFKFSCSGIHSSGTVEKTWSDGGSGYTFNYTSSQEETWEIETFSVSNKSGSQTATLNNNFSLVVTQNDDEYAITFSIPVSENYWYWEMYSGNTYSDLQDYDAKKLEVSFYGDKRVISFEEVDCSSKGIESAVTLVSIPTNELMQNLSDVTAIRDNILEDYANGVPTATIDLFCGLGDWKNGEIIKVNDVLTFDDDLDKNSAKNLWKVTGRTFKYQGAPTLSLELQSVQGWKVVWQDENGVSTTFEDFTSVGRKENDIISPITILDNSGYAVSGYIIDDRNKIFLFERADNNTSYPISERPSINNYVFFSFATPNTIKVTAECRTSGLSYDSHLYYAKQVIITKIWQYY